jgi:hypothetical protein
MVSFEQIATAIGGISEAYKKQVERQYPDRQQFREAKVTRVPSEEDRIREAQGASDAPIDQWLGEDIEEDIGVREREWIERNARSKATG